MWKLICWHNQDKEPAIELGKALQRKLSRGIPDSVWADRKSIYESFINDQGVFNTFLIRRLNQSNDPDDLSKTIWEYEFNLVLMFESVEFEMPIAMFEYKEKK